jgi:hypothetical protein
MLGAPATQVGYHCVQRVSPPAPEGTAIRGGTGNPGSTRWCVSRPSLWPFPTMGVAYDGGTLARCASRQRSDEASSSGRLHRFIPSALAARTACAQRTSIADSFSP